MQYNKMPAYNDLTLYNFEFVFINHFSSRLVPLAAERMCDVIVWRSDFMNNKSIVFNEHSLRLFEPERKVWRVKDRQIGPILMD